MKSFYRTNLFAICVMLVASGCGTNIDPRDKIAKDLETAKSRLQETHFALQRRDFIKARRLAESALLDTRVVVAEWQTEQTKKTAAEERAHLNYLEQKYDQLATTISEHETVEEQFQQTLQEKEQLLKEVKQLDGEVSSTEEPPRASEIASTLAEQTASEREIERLQQQKGVLLLESSNQALTVKGLAELTPTIIQKELAELQPQQTTEGWVIPLKYTSYETEQVSLSAGNLDIIEKIANFLKTYHCHILIKSYIDNSKGDEKYNLYISQRRSDIVRSNLLSKGIEAHRISTKGITQQSPVEDDYKDRQIEIVILN